MWWSRALEMRMFTEINSTRAIDPIEIAAMAIYDADEDMVDENIAAAVASGDYSWSEIRFPRKAWEALSESVQTAYRRRARAAFAAVAYKRPEEATLSAIQVGRRRFNLVEASN